LTLNCIKYSALAGYTAETFLSHTSGYQTITCLQYRTIQELQYKFAQGFKPGTYCINCTTERHIVFKKVQTARRAA